MTHGVLNLRVRPMTSAMLMALKCNLQKTQTILTSRISHVEEFHSLDDDQLLMMEKVPHQDQNSLWTQHSGAY